MINGCQGLLRNKEDYIGDINGDFKVKKLFCIIL